MTTHLTNGNVDLDRYLRDGPPITKVKPARTFLPQLRAAFNDEEKRTWGNLPFRKTLDQVRLRRGDMSIWSGINGDGKSALLGQVMLGLMAAGERVCMASLEMKPEETLKRMTQQASAEARPPDAFLDDFAAWTDGRFWIYDHLGTVRWKYMVALARFLHAEIGITHFVIDSFTKCGLAPDDFEGQKQFVDELFSHAKATGMHVHLVCHQRKADKYSKRPSKFDVRGAGEITDLPDNLFMVVRNREKEEKRDDPKYQKEPDTFLIVEKQRNHSFEGTVGLWFFPTVRRWVELGLENPEPMELGITSSTPELQEF